MLFRHLCIAILALCIGTSAHSATKEDVTAIVRVLKENPMNKYESGHRIILPRTDGDLGEMVISVIDKGLAPILFIQAQHTISGESIGYPLDTECIASMTDVGPRGAVTGIRLDCIAWTPGQEQYLAEKKQHIYDNLIIEAKELLGIK